MVEVDKKTVKKATQLLDLARQKHNELGEYLVEIDQLLAGGMSMSEKLKALEFAFESCWRARYDAAYLWNFNEDRKHWKQLLKKLSVGELQLRMARYLKDEDTFYMKEHHRFRYFWSNINIWSEQPELGNQNQGVLNCSHLPRCKDDAEHTKKMLRDDYQGMGV